MTLEEALDTLRGGGELPALSEAIGVVISDPTTSLEGVMLGLKHRGFVAEQAALTLYARTSRSLPDDRSLLVTDPDEWTRWLLAQPCRVNVHAGRGSSDEDQTPTITATGRDGKAERRTETAPLPYLLVAGCIACVFGGVTLYAISAGASWAAIPIAVAVVCATIIGIVPPVQSISIRARKSDADFDKGGSLQRLWDAVDQAEPTARDLRTALERVEALLKARDAEQLPTGRGEPARDPWTSRQVLQSEDSEWWDLFAGDRSEAEGVLAPHYRFCEEMWAGIPSMLPRRR